MHTPPSPVIDLHTHYYEPAWRSAPLPSAGSFARVWPLLCDLPAQLDALQAAGINGKVLSAPASGLVEPGQHLSHDTIRAINERLASLITLHPRRLLAVATIDPWAGDAAAREVERAALALHMRGIVIDASCDGRFLDDPAARPTFDAAASYGMAVFIHPTHPPAMAQALAGAGPTGLLLARGTDTAASVLALLRSGRLSAYPAPRVIIPAIAAAALHFAAVAEQYEAFEESAYTWGGAVPSVLRRHLHIDTMGLDPALLRMCVDLLGVEQVHYGTDWPLLRLPDRTAIQQMFQLAGIDDPVQQAVILSGNTLRLLGENQINH